ncbi:hypothetical protein GCM10019016_035740 [Streptomyces prasinosporus]|uniref:Transposase n=1 Tax=Streptomyces prasinosporus TaxID=68256 RepID=A0ABP6TMI1_9ACTN
MGVALPRLDEAAALPWVLERVPPGRRARPAARAVLALLPNRPPPTGRWAGTDQPSAGWSLSEMLLMQYRWSVGVG